jgi:small subunit ribosomal protein S19
MRSKWKIPFIASSLIRKKREEPFKKIWSRSSVITKKFLNQRVLVHNGNSFKTVFINQQKLGFKYGEFSFTRSKTKKLKK